MRLLYGIAALTPAARRDAFGVAFSERAASGGRGREEPIGPYRIRPRWHLVETHYFAGIKEDPPPILVRLGSHLAPSMA
jgi:hypothetical protein